MNKTVSHIAYLCSQVTIAGSPIRRPDAFEHDRTMDALRPAFENLEMRLTEVSWDATEADWRRYDAVIIGTTWDYWDRSDLFLKTLQRIESQTRLYNSSSIVVWNLNKQYLKEFADCGVRSIPTVWIDTPDAVTVEQAFRALDCDQIVLKRQIGAGAFGQHLLQRGESIPELTRPMLAQPFLSSIQTEGELSMIFIDGEFCHALMKHAVDGDYRIQSSYGGTEEAISPSEADLSAAIGVVKSLPEKPLYARVDMIRGDSGILYLMELELIEPYLYPIEGPLLGPMMAAAIAERLNGPSV